VARSACDGTSGERELQPDKDRRYWSRADVAAAAGEPVGRAGGECRASDRCRSVGRAGGECWASDRCRSVGRAGGEGRASDRCRLVGRAGGECRASDR
jgi:hypothetical protein